jgi:hypothetical protein|tara:strand:- start:96 stop:308 length:213 start_codon:yes stop_codon:yes gene_type:complete
MDIEVVEINEVWWASTKQYDLVVNEENLSVRWAENPKGSDYYIEVNGQWESWDTDTEYPEVYEAIMEGLE